MSQRFRPPFGFTLFFLSAFSVLIGLGIWQVHRLQWKNDLLKTREYRITAPAIPLEEALYSPPEAEYRRGMVRGQFHHEDEFFKAEPSLRGEPGYLIITPLELEAHPGTFLLINRGWVPLSMKDPQQRSLGQIAGTVVIQGTFRQPHAPGKIFQWILKNNPSSNFWYWFDIPAMEKASSIKGSMVRELYLETDATPNPGGWPQGGQMRANISNNHLQYALTWFTLAGILIIIFVVYGLRNGKKYDTLSET